jgi:hypothetical protein
MAFEEAFEQVLKRLLRAAKKRDPHEMGRTGCASVWRDRRI